MICKKYMTYMTYTTYRTYAFPHLPALYVGQDAPTTVTLSVTPVKAAGQ
jgi:hypothetical protein